jgi:hypothetical protein
MSEYLYRFRSAESFLERKELDNQEIYFSSLDQLNDPLEGFKNIFWSGDKIVWKNLLKNYLLCLLHVNGLFFIGGDKYEIKDDDIPVFNPCPLPDIHSKVYQESCRLFFENELIQKYPIWLSSDEKKISRNELLFYLKSLHRYALKCIFIQFDIHIHQPKIFEFLQKSEEELLPDDKIKENKEETYFSKKIIEDQLYLITLQNNQELINSSNKRFIFFEFTEKYLKQLESLIYYQYYVACFSDDYKNPALWGYYGDCHKGICLKYKTSVNNENQPVIKLRSINGFTGYKNKSKPTFGFAERKFIKVNYSEKHPEIDFFRSLGRLPIPLLYEHWYTDENKNISSCADILNDEKWQAGYWKIFESNINTKLHGWSHEKEYRLSFFSFLFDLKDPEFIIHRKLKYNFKDLEGIIFGVQTHLKEKIKIIRIISDKIKKENHKDFKFYQAYYSQKTGNIEAEELDFLNMHNKNVLESVSER